MKATLWVLALALFGSCVLADLYMHNPRGSSDRNREPNQNRNNANRLFNSQNNDAGGHPWAGDPKLQGAPDPLMFYANSKLRLEWTVQHSCGPGGNIECDLIIQYMSTPVSTSTSANALRDGYPTGPLKDRAAGYQQATFVDPNQNADGTNTLPLPTAFPQASGNQFADGDAFFGSAVPADVRDANFAAFCAGQAVGPYNGIEFGMHESCETYRQCTRTSRQKGLYTADQALGGESARFTRQNNNGNRHGLECPEERDYYPYWRASEWKDVAILTSNLTWCATTQQYSQNINDRHRCVMPATSTALAPLSAAGCAKALGTWVTIPSWGLPAPDCILHATTRDNHLGNSGEPHNFRTVQNPVTASYIWTIPPELRGQRVVVRFRYNMSSTTYDSHADFVPGSTVAMTDSKMNCEGGAVGVKGGGQCSNDLTANGPIAMYTNPYVKLWSSAVENDGINHVYLALAQNANQLGRTFQDRSYVFEVKQEMPTCAGEVINVNVRGKRGNIVQTFPSTEYDFVPAHLQLTTTDCIDLQWTGSDFCQTNVAGEGADQTDRHNLVELRANSPGSSLHTIPQYGPRVTMFDQATAKQLAYSNQTLANCLDLNTANGNNNQLFLNCAKLNSAPNTYRHPTLISFSSIGTWTAISTRNNNFSNRHQKLIVVVTSPVNYGVIIAAAIIAALAVAGITLGCFARNRPDSHFAKGVHALFYGRKPLENTTQIANMGKYQNVADVAAVAK